MTMTLNPKGRKETPEEAAQRCAEALARRRAEGGRKLRPAATDYTVSTPDGASWPDGDRYMVWQWPTQSHSRGGLAFSPSKRTSRVKQHA